MLLQTNLFQQFVFLFIIFFSLLLLLFKKKKKKKNRNKISQTFIYWTHKKSKLIAFDFYMVKERRRRRKKKPIKTLSYPPYILAYIYICTHAIIQTLCTGPYLNSWLGLSWPGYRYWWYRLVFKQEWRKKKSVIFIWCSIQNTNKNFVLE